MSSPPLGVGTVAGDGVDVDVRASSPGGLRRIRVHEGGDIGKLPVVEPSSRSGRRIALLAKEPPSRGVAEPFSRCERHLIKASTRSRVVSDRRGLARRQARQTAVRAPPAVLCVNPRGASPRPAAAEDMGSSRDELVAVYKGGRILYLAYFRTFKRADHPGVTLSPRLSTTPDGDHHGEIVWPAPSRSLLGGCRAEGASRHGVHRRGLRHPSPSARQPPNLYHLLEDSVSGLVDSTIAMQIFDHKSNDNELKFSQEEKKDMIESFGKLKVSKVRSEFLKMEKSFMKLIESSDKAIERQIVDSIYSFAQDNQVVVTKCIMLCHRGWNTKRYLIPVAKVTTLKLIQVITLNLMGMTWNLVILVLSKVVMTGDDDDGGGGDDEEEDDDEEDDDDEEENEEDDDEEEDEEEDDDEEEDEEEDDDEEDDEEEDEDYDPVHDDDEDDDDEYMNGLANLPPLPPGTEYWNGVTVVTGVSAIHNLNPQFHVLGFGPNLTIHQRVRLWATGDAMGFDFHPTEMLRYVWRMELLLNGQNPGNPLDAENEPPVPNPGDYDDEGWITDEDMAGGIALDDLGLDSSSV
uniref:Uncharacterized protein n=3 Tax=Oryza TaxID=4527 RepID=A0A0D3ERY4_9ORYZ